GRDVRSAHCLQRLLARDLARGLPEELERIDEAAADRCDEELLLRAEQAEEVGLREPDALGDALGRGAVEAVLAELRDRGFEHLVAALLRGLPLRCRNHDT